jgi:hypothetical protein
MERNISTGDDCYGAAFPIPILLCLAADNEQFGPAGAPRSLVHFVLPPFEIDVNPP